MKKPSKRAAAAATPPPAIAEPTQPTLQMPAEDEALRLAEAWRVQFQSTAGALSVEGRHPLPMMIGTLVAIGRLVGLVAGSNPTECDVLTENLVRDFRLAVLSTRSGGPTSVN